ncbi:hypothetical protein ACFSJ3_12675 [Corallincola platygyrae]|uniref:Uncharacterized protein n=1 Tax=Corallincola platygyrae TaxID=1193278 RepID=A0ABW4XSP2_9GAMM
MDEKLKNLLNDYYSSYGRARLDGPPEFLISEINSSNRADVFDFVIGRETVSISRETVSFLFLIDDIMALKKLGEKKLFESMSDEAKVEFHMQKYKLDGELDFCVTGLIAAFSSSITDARNLAINYFPVKDVKSTWLEQLITLVNEESDKTTFIQGVQKVLSIMGFEFGDEEYKKHYIVLRSGDINKKHYLLELMKSIGYSSSS